VIDDLLTSFGRHTGEYALLVAALLGLSHLLGPFVRNVFRNNPAKVISFGGGLAIAYVFIKLIPEIEEAHVFLGDRTHVIVLFSFLAFHAIELKLIRPITIQNAVEGDDSDNSRLFWMHIAVIWVYSFMVVFALPDRVSQSFVIAALSGVAIGLHCLYKGVILHGEFRELYERRARFLLLSAPILGWLAHIVIQPSEQVFSVAIAMLAGFLMQGVFRQELPSLNRTRFSWMVAGALIFLAIVLIAAI
jgi:hypothetical protein